MKSLKLSLRKASDYSQLAYANYCAWKTDRKIVVFESDDWGGVRMPNAVTLQCLLDAGLKVDDVSFNRLDGIERRDDLDRLLDVLAKHRNSRGIPCKFTCNMVLGNPDFEAIENNNFSEFVHESMFDSYRRYYADDLRPVWRKAIDDGLVQPQFHCREHLNTQLWMRDLQAEQPETMLCFKHRFFGLRTKTTSKVQKHYLAAYSAETGEELDVVKKITSDGLDLFESMFGFRSQTFIACNYVWPIELEDTLHAGGVKIIQTRIKHTRPILAKGGQREHIRRYSGELNRLGQRYSVRNVLFEPYREQARPHKIPIDSVARAMVGITQAFWFKVPAVISTHRVNYSSAMNADNRDANLRKLDRLLAQIVERWPDVEFLTSNELADEFMKQPENC